MSLEQVISELAEAVRENTATLKQVLAQDVAAGGAASGEGSTAEAPKRTRRTKEQIEADKAKETAGAADTKSEDKGAVISGEALQKKLGDWLGEFAKAEDKDNPDGTHPEVTARREALRGVLEKLTGQSTGGLKIAIGDADMTAKLNTWFETKAKVVDKGFGAGRLVADPAPAEDDDAEDDDLGGL